MGDMILPLDPDQPLVFVAGGIGVASFISIIEWLHAHNESRQITLLYAVRKADDIIFQELIDTYASSHPLTPLLYTPDVNSAHVWKGQVLHQRLTATEVMEYVRDESQIYLSGTERMVEEIRKSLQDDYKIPQYRIAFDYFDGYTEA
jgi:ferredoxin-NADP reductase